MPEACARSPSAEIFLGLINGGAHPTVFSFGEGIALGLFPLLVTDFHQAFRYPVS